MAIASPSQDGHRPPDGGDHRVGVEGPSCAQVRNGPGSAGTPHSLLQQLMATMVPLAILLAGFQTVVHELWVDHHHYWGEISFWYHYGALALCYLLGLHWARHRRVLGALQAALQAAAIMTLVTVILTYVGIAVGICVAGIAEALLPRSGAGWLAVVVVPSLAGMAWGLAVGALANRFLDAGDLPADWLRLHAVWGAVAGPAMLWYALAAPSSYAATLTTAIATLALSVLTSWSLQR